MQFFDPLTQLILSQAQTPEEARQLAEDLVRVDWHSMFVLKEHCEREIASIQQQINEDTSALGVCQLCKMHKAMAEMVTHLKTCLQRQESLRARVRSQMYPKFLIFVEGSDFPAYWGYVEMGQGSRLSALDEILRKTWLECCGHLSAFTIGGRRYESHADVSEDWNPLEADSMEATLEQVLHLGMTFGYEYDFGSSTDLKLRVIDAYERKSLKGRSAPVLARNIPPVISCFLCNQPATRVCPQCREYDSLGGRGWYCLRCAKQHECDVERMLPVVNSPRVGVCGYTGRAYHLSHEDF